MPHRCLGDVEAGLYKVVAAFSAVKGRFPHGFDAEEAKPSKSFLGRPT